MARKPLKKRRGRPVGSKTQEPPPKYEVLPNRCPRCGSTRRSPYTHTERSSWFDRDGDRCQQITHRTQCLDCGFKREDVTHEYRGRFITNDN